MIGTPNGSAARRPGVWRRLAQNRVAALGTLLVAVIVLTAVLAPLLPLADPAATAPADRLQPPLTGEGLLGTDALGRDLLSRLIWGARISLAVGLAATLVAAAIGSAIGLVAASAGGLADQVLMRAIDMLMAFPYLLLALAIVAALGPGLMNALLAIAVVNIPFFARTVRGATLTLVQQDFIAAAHLAGLSRLRILVSELLPNVLPVIVVTMSTTLGWMILETAGLSFLGLGAQPPQADLGSMLADGRKVVVMAPHVAAAPGLLILFLVIGINLLGDGLRDILDPRLKAGALSRPVARTETAPAWQRAAWAKHRPEPEPPRADRKAGAPDPVLSVRGLVTEFRLGATVAPAANQVDFDLEHGDSLGIVGESGSGKSVTVLSLLGLVPTPPGRIAAGSVRLQDGRNLLDLPLSALQDLRGNRLAYIFQSPYTSLNPLLTVGAQVAETIRRHQRAGRVEAWRQTVALFERVELPRSAETARAYPHELSGGMRQRVGIAMALANQPDILIADEPTTALDTLTQARVLDLLSGLRRDTGAALIFIAHDIGVIAALCTRVLVMYAGRVVESGPVDQVFARPRHPYTRGLLACVPVLGQPERALDAIPGLPPPLEDLPAGCAFAARCPLVIDACRREAIALRAVGPGHAARCLRAEEV